MTPLAAHAWTRAELAAWSRPPDDANKRAVLATLPDGPVPDGTVHVARWPAPALPPARTPGRAEVHPRDGWFDYGNTPPVGDARARWWVNFADPELFGFWDTGLLAQDELQCLEIPELPAARAALAAAGVPTRTVGADGRATPVTVHGALRRLALDTAPAPQRPWGLYGGAFACAPAPVVRAATRVLDPPTPVHVLAVAAPRGRGVYDESTIRGTLETAHAGFLAARAATAAVGGDADAVVVHTGWWGCGAFGGHRELMALVQLEAADLAGLAGLVFHTGEPGAHGPLADARDVQSRLRGEASVDGWLAAVARRGYRWGTPNGT